MPLFISDEEFLRCSGDAGQVAEKADDFIRKLSAEVEKVKSDAAAASVVLEQSCFNIQQKYESLSTEHALLHSQHLDLNSLLEQRASEVERLQAEKQQHLFQSFEKDGEIERLKREASEFHATKRQLMELLEHKELEISEKNANIKSYLDKIVNLTENATSKEARLADLEFELGQLKATSARLLQEKELLERHNAWLNEDLAAKVDSLIQLRKENGELEADMSSKLSNAEKKLKENSSSLKLHQGAVKNLEEKLAAAERELSSIKDAAAAAEEIFSAEISTTNKLVDLYKESCEEWSKKAVDLEGVIKALEVHLDQVETEYKGKLEKEEARRKEVEKESSDLKDQLQTCLAELEAVRKRNERQIHSLSSIAIDTFPISADPDQPIADDRAIVPIIPSGISGTALAASLLRDGWTLVKLYSKYQEATDALRHEQMGRKQAQSVLERVLYEIEEKAGAILAEREEHEKFLEAYSSLEQKLLHSKLEHSSLEYTIQELQANLKRQERDYGIAQKEILDLQKQVAILIKECRDVQLRCGGSAAPYNDNELIVASVGSLHAESSTDQIISERLLTFKDINGLVETNVQLRTLTRKLAEQIEEKEADFKAKYEKELQKHSEDAASKVSAVLQRAEQQSEMIESLHNSVALYKKLYEEKQNLHYDPSGSGNQDAVPEQQSSKAVRLHDHTYDMERIAQNQAFDRLKDLEEDLARLRNEAVSLRAEREKLVLEAQYTQEKLARFMKEFEHQKEEHNGVLARNIEFQKLIVDYQKKLHESAQSVDASNELSRKLSMEVSILKHEKEIIQNAEKRASDEIRSLSERFHRLQATLETINSTEDVREEARSSERKQREAYTNKIERDWAEVKQELQEERINARNLTLERENTLRNALVQVEDLRKELAEALRSASAAEARAAVAEARCSDLEKILDSGIKTVSDGLEGSTSSSEKIATNLRGEVEKLRGEVEASNDHMLQYKHLAEVNEEACKQMELAHENFKSEVNEVKRSLEAELKSLRDQALQLEAESKSKIEELISANAEKEDALAIASSEISSLKNDCSIKMSQIMVMESQISALKENLKEEHARWQTANENYERQVILQSDTIKELTKTSKAFASAQEESSELRKLIDVLTAKNNELKSKWETEKLTIDVYKKGADDKYAEIDELNKVLFSRIEALNIKLAEKERGTTSETISKVSNDENGMLPVVNYLRRTKEIAETEISLLKQEKLRLQTQLETSLKSCEAAQASLSEERAKSRASLLNEEDFKSIQLQVRELNLLRESNLQLREENKHNFEECQKLREAFQTAKIETDNLEKLLRERDSELENCRKEIENLKTEKRNLEHRIDELVNKYKDIDVHDYNLLKESSRQTGAILRDKDSQLEELRKLLSEKQDTVSVMEQNLATSSAESNEREARIKELLQSQASLKSEVDKVRRFNVQLRKRLESEKEQLSKEIETLSKDVNLRKKLESEKEQLSKELEALSKELEAIRQGSVEEQVAREKEREKETRIQMLEKIVERLREDLKKEKDDHHKEKDRLQKIRKTAYDSREAVMQEKKNLSLQLDKHKGALKLLEEEVEKLKNNGGSQPESISMGQHISSNVLDDFASAYYQAVENFSRVAESAGNELPATSDALSVDPSSAAAQSSHAVAPVIQSLPVPPATRTIDEKEKSIAAAKPNAKTMRRLVRPNVTKPKEPQTDVDMAEADDSSAGLSSQGVESQGNTSLLATAAVRKRPLPSSSADVHEEMPVAEEPSSDMPPPPPKKSKASDDQAPDVNEEAPVIPPPSAPSDVALDVAETPEDAVIPLQGNIVEFIDVVDEVETVSEQVEEPNTDEQTQTEVLTEPGEITEDKVENSSERLPSDDQLRDQTEQDIQQIVSESGYEREEGEAVTDVEDNEGDSNMSRDETGGAVTGDSSQAAQSPSNDPLFPSSLEAGEIDRAEMQTSIDGANEANDSSTTIPDVGSAVEEASTSTSAVVAASEQGGSASPAQESGKPVSPVNNSPTTINLQARARERASLRQAGMGSGMVIRGRGRVQGGRGVARGGRPGRGRSTGGGS